MKLNSTQLCTLIEGILRENWQHDLEDDLYLELSRMDVDDNWMYNAHIVDELRGRLGNLGYSDNEMDLVLPQAMGEADDRARPLAGGGDKMAAADARSGSAADKGAKKGGTHNNDPAKRPGEDEDSRAEGFENWIKLVARLSDSDPQDLYHRRNRQAQAAYDKGDTAQSFARQIKGRRNRWR